MEASPTATSNNSAARQSPTLGPVRDSPRPPLTFVPVYEEGEQPNPALRVGAHTGSTHPNLAGFAGRFSPFSQHSAMPQPAAKLSPKSGQQSAQGHQAASSSGSHRRDSNLAALRLAISTAVACTEKTPRSSRANSLNDQDLPTPQRSLLLSLELPAIEPQRLRVHPRSKSLSSPKEPKEPKVYPSTPRRSPIHQHLAQAHASAANGQTTSMKGRTSKFGLQFKSLDQRSKGGGQTTKLKDRVTSSSGGGLRTSSCCETA